MNPPGPYLQLIVFILWIFWIILINTNWFLVRKDFISIQLYSLHYSLCILFLCTRDLQNIEKKSDIRLWQRSSPLGRQTVSEIMIKMSKPSDRSSPTSSAPSPTSWAVMSLSGAVWSWPGSSSPFSPALLSPSLCSPGNPQSSSWLELPTR